jgi:predicted anti-sigma-YlaC factor YlaD
METSNKTKLEKLLDADSILLMGTTEATGVSAAFTSYLLGNSLYVNIAAGVICGATVIAEGKYRVLSRSYYCLKNFLKQHI